MKLTNNASRALGVPGAHGSYIVKPKDSINITQMDLEALERNKTASGWLHTGLISIDGKGTVKESPAKEKPPEPQEPKVEPSGSDPEVVEQSKGWYKVFVGGIEVSQGNMRKADAEALAAQYEDGDDE